MLRLLVARIRAGAEMAIFFAIALGLGLAAAAGLRVFVPVFGAALAAHLGLVEIDPAFAWLGTTTALITLGTATVAEVLAYYVLWLDHALDVIATPAAVGAGILASAAVLVDLPPGLQWGVAIIGGGGAAGLVQAMSVGARLKSAFTTGGLGNPVVATAETLASITLVALALVVPVLLLLLLAALGVLVARGAGRRTPHTASDGSAPPAV